MKRIILLLVLVNILSNVLNAQVLDGIYVKEHVPARKPIPYYHLREADVSWSKTVWRMLDLKEKQNHNFYYPIEPTDDRLSLVALMVSGIENEGTVVYDPDDDFNEFGLELTQEDVKIRLGAEPDSSEVENLETGEYEWKFTTKDINYAEMQRVLMKEQWVFDKQRARIEIRIIGLCPVRRYTKGDGEAEDGEELILTPKKLFWAYFPSYRNLFAKQEVFNPMNDSERRTFDDIFFKRKFASHIYRVTNEYENRLMTSYKKGEDLLLEAERIKDFLFKFEHDLWEF